MHFAGTGNMDFWRQTWTLTKKDLLLILRRRWFSTFVRALAFPVVLTVIIAEVKHWIGNHGGYGVGSPSSLLSLPEAFDYVGSTRPEFVIIDRGLPGDDVRLVIQQLSTLATQGKRNLHNISNTRSLRDICPSSNRGTTSCFAAVDFWGSPNSSPGALWNYTIYQDGVIQGGDVRSDRNSLQTYTLPLQHTIDSLIANTTGGARLPETIMQYPFTQQSQAYMDFQDREFYSSLVLLALAFALFLAMCGVTYHLTGHVVRQRENGMLELIDAMMPNRSRWQRQTARMLATHLAFDIVYVPSYIICGAVAGAVIFPTSNPGWYVLMYLLCGLAMCSLSILVSSLFRRTQLSAISAVVASVCFAIVAQFAESGDRGTSTAGALATGILFPPSSFVYFLISGAVFEIFGQAMDPSSNLPPVALLLGKNIWVIKPAAFLGFFAFHIIVFPILSIFIEHYMWGCSSLGRNLRTTSEMGGSAIRLVNFSKRYNIAAKKRDRTLAVNDLSLDLHAGSITILLGANGSGKSTTLNCIAGLSSISSGQIDIDGSGGIGLCPQKNVLWPDMTVYEHVLCFQRIKAPHLSLKEAEAEVVRLIEGCDLAHKTHAYSKTLSGGQMRKLQLAMMLAGGSRVCCIDEASSGIDPLARRKIWDILIRERGQRTLLMTTHFLDESEVLADHIALLSKGELRTQGSVAALKGSELGGGYRVMVPSKDVRLVSPDNANVVFEEVANLNGTEYRTPNSASLSWLVNCLEQKQIRDYEIEGPTIERLFLRLADEMKMNSEEDTDSHEEKGSMAVVAHKPLVLHAGKGCGPIRQTGVLFHKRLTVLKHNFMPYIISLFVPLTIAGLVTRFLLSTHGTGLQCHNPGISPDIYALEPPSSLAIYDFDENFVLGPLPTVTGQQIFGLIPNKSFNHFTSVDFQVYPINVTTSQDFNATIRSFQPANDFRSVLIEELLGNDESRSSLGGIFLGRSEAPLFAWNTESYDIPTAVALQSAMNMRLLNTSIAFSYQRFAVGYTPRDFLQSLVAVFTVLGFSLYPGLFALYPTAERLRKVRAMHYSNGITSGPVWSAYALFDFFFLLLIAILVIVIWVVTYQGWYELGYMFVVFLFYGLAATAYSYVISLFVGSQLAVIALTTIVQVVIAMLFFVGCFLTVDMAEPQTIASQLDILYFTIGLICPAVSLFRALLICLNVYSIACRGTNFGTNPGSITLYGGPILYLVVQFFLLVLFLIYWESGRSFSVFGLGRKREIHQSVDDEIELAGKTDADEDPARLSPENDGLRVEHISKRFGDNLAVDNVSFGILPSEKFALLGPNGAGKSTTISLIRDEIRPDTTQPAGEIYISSDSLKRSPVQARQHLGVCPQFDAVDSMTLSEHLHFYARARGVTGKQKDENIQEIVTRLGLEDHVNKLVKKLSGGTKRKLSLAIALIGNPSVLLLDEPSSGMDPAAKRALWETLRSISAGRSLLLTTHSMEEADALCDRAGIMASKMLALGTISDLHRRHGNRIYLQLVHADAPRTSSEEMESLWQWVRSTFAVAETEKAISGHLRFTIPVTRADDDTSGLLDGSHIGQLYQTMEAHKEQLRITDYAVGPATLDQVFINVVSRHNVREENSQVTNSSYLKRRSDRKAANIEQREK